jgi:hypothetical protein
MKGGAGSSRISDLHEMEERLKARFVKKVTKKE